MAMKGDSVVMQAQAGRGNWGLEKGEEGVVGPISLPTNALETVFSFLPRSERARLALVNWQVAEVVVPGVNAERQKVSPLMIPISHSHHTTDALPVPDPHHIPSRYRQLPSASRGDHHTAQRAWHHPGTGP